MTSVRVAVRVRPLNNREIDSESAVIVEIHGNKTVITNTKIPLVGNEGDTARRQLRTQEFTFDHSFWSVNGQDAHFVGQEQVYRDLGEDVLSSAFAGYNLCVFAYGQTGSGKSYTMSGSPDNQGFIPRFCQDLFSRVKDDKATYKVQLSYLEIYMGSMKEDIRDLLSNTSTRKLLLRNHPETGPYVEGLSKHTVSSYDDIEQFLEKGNSRRVTASTKMNDTSSRSHAVFTIFLSQASIVDGVPSGKQSKIHLVDLAGSENARAAETTGQRLKEGAGINKSLLALKQVIRRLATSSKGGRKESATFINYRNSDLTFLLKDSLGGNSKTVMIATISPAESCYEESISTLRYARDAKRIINQPTVNEDQNVKLIRELKEEIARLTAQLADRNEEHVSDVVMQEKLHENEARIKVLTEEWFGKWNESFVSKEEGGWEVRREGKGLAIDSELPHLIRDDIFTTGIYMYPLKEGKVILGQENAENPPYIVLEGEGVLKEHCAIEVMGDRTVLQPFPHAFCTINNIEISMPAILRQGDVVALGLGNKFRYNHPGEAARLKAEYSQVSALLWLAHHGFRTAQSTTNLLEVGNGSLLTLPQCSIISQSLGDLCLCRSSENLALAAQGTETQQKREEEQEMLNQKRRELEELEEELRLREDQRTAELARLEEEVARRQRHLDQVEAELQAAQLKVLELEKGQDAEGDAARIRSLLEQERKLLEEMEARKQQLQKAVEELQRHWEELSGEMEASLAELRRQEAEKHQVLAVLEKDIASKHQAQTRARDEEHAALEEDRRQVKELRHKLFLEQEKLTSGNKELQEKLNQLEQAESKLTEKYERLEREHGLDWKKRFTELSEEDKTLDEAWIDFREQEAHLKEEKQNLKDDNLGERQRLENDQRELEMVREHLEQERRKIVAREKELEEEIECETRRWELMKQGELGMLQNERSKLDLRSETTARLEKEIVERESAVQARQARLLEQEEAVIQVELKARGRLEEMKREHMMVQEERQRLQRQLRDATQEMDAVKCQMQGRLEDIDRECEEKVQEIRRERERLQSLHGGKAVDGEASSEAAAELNNLRQNQESLQGQLEKALSNLEDARTRFEMERDEDQSNLDNVFYQVKDLEHSEKINTLVEKELQARQARERWEQSKWMEEMEQEMKIRSINERKQILESRAQDKREIFRLRQELHSLRGKFPSMESLDGQPSLLNSNNTLHIKSSSPFYADGGDVMTRKSSTNSSSSNGARSSRPKVSIPSSVVRGFGAAVHHEYEVKITAGNESWTIYRRYRSFREMHQALKLKYPAHMNILVFPPKKIFSRSEKVVAERRVKLENYLTYLLELGRRIPGCSLHSDQNKVTTKQAIWDFDPFFRVGALENSVQHSS